MKAAVTHALRSDAQRNRERIVDAAREVFTAEGLEAPLDEIAERAGVGIGTLYRRFPTREELFEAVFARQIEIFSEIAEEALAHDDAWEGFALFVERVGEVQARDRGLKDMLMMRFPNAPLMEESRRRGRATIKQLIERAQAQGTMRPDVAPEDVAFIFLANARFVEATAHVAPNAWRRGIALLLDGFRAECASELPRSPLTQKQLFHAMAGLARHACGRH